MQNFIQKKKKERKDKNSRKRQKVGHKREKGNFVQHTLPSFLPHFLSILERLNCGGSREKMARPHHFSLPLPLSSKHPSHPFSLLFSTIFFFSILPKIHPSKHSVSLCLSLFIWRLKANESLSLWDFIWDFI